MRRHRWLFLAVVTLTLGAAPRGFAQPSDRPDARDAVQVDSTRLADYVDALIRRDVDAVLTHWAEDGALDLPFARIGAPQRFAGHRALQTHYRAWLDSVRVTGVKRIVPLSVDVGRNGGHGRDEGPPGRQYVVRYDAVVVRGDARSEQDFAAFVTLRGRRIQSMMCVPDPIVLRDGFAPGPSGDGRW